MEKTLFERIIDGELPSDRVYEDDRCIVIRDIQPQAPTHVLIIPRDPIPRLIDANDTHQELLGHLLLVAGKVAELLGVVMRLGWSLTMAPMRDKRYFICTCTY